MCHLCPYDIEKTTEGMLRVFFSLHTLIDLYQYRLMMVTIAGQGRKRVVMLASCNQERSEKAESINSN